MFADDVLVGEASSAPARWCASRRRTVLTASSSTSTTLRLQPMWEGTQSWAVAARLDRVSGRRAGAGHRRRPARLSADPARRLGRHRRRARRHNDETPILAGRRVDLDRNGGAELTLSGTGDQTTWGGFVDIPDALRQSIGVQLVRQQWQRRDLGDDHLDRGGREERRSDQRRPPAAVVGAAVGEAGGKRNGAAQLQPAGHRRHRLRGGAAAGRSVRHQRLARRQTPCGRVRKVAAITVFPPHPRRHL